MSNKMHLMLASLFHWHLSAENSGWAPISILHRISTEGVVVRSGKPGHNILCREMTPDQRRAQRAFNQLALDEKILVVAKHYPCSPIGENAKFLYKTWTDKEKAHYLQLSPWDFNRKYNDILKKAQKLTKNT